MEHLFIEAPDVLAQARTVNEHLDVWALHLLNILVAFNDDGIWLCHVFDTAF